MVDLISDIISSQVYRAFLFSQLNCGSLEWKRKPQKTITLTQWRGRGRSIRVGNWRSIQTIYLFPFLFYHPGSLFVHIFSYLSFFSIRLMTHLRHRRLLHIPTRRRHSRRRNHCPTSSWRPARRPRDTFPWPLQVQNWFRPLTMT